MSTLSFIVFGKMRSGIIVSGNSDMYSGNK